MLSKLLGKLTAQQIKLGLGECIKLAQKGREWPPTPIEFISLCKMAGADARGGYDRLISREPPANAAEKKTRSQVGFNVRSLPDDKARRMWNEYYMQNYQAMMEGNLKDDAPPLLTEHVAARPSDTMRDNFKPTTTEAAKMMQRLNKLRGK